MNDSPYYAHAVQLLRVLSEPAGIHASGTPTANYRAVFVRDAVMAGIAGLPSVTSVQGHLTLTFSVPAGAGGVTETVQVSGDLATWHSGSGFTETMSDTTAAGIRTIVVRDVATSPPRYIRLRISR